MTAGVSDDFLHSANAKEGAALAEDYGALARTLARRGVDIEAITRSVEAFAVASQT